MSTHHGFIKEFPFIRVDAFNGDPKQVNPYTGLGPTISLLSHAHTDHLAGLASAAFDHDVHCTAVTRELVTGTVAAADRVRNEVNPGSRREYKFANLRRRDARHGGKLGGERLVSERVAVAERGERGLTSVGGRRD